MAPTLPCPGPMVIPASPRMSVSAVICVAPKVVCLPLLLVVCLTRAVGSLSAFILCFYYLNPSVVVYSGFYGIGDRPWFVSICSR